MFGKLIGPGINKFFKRGGDELDRHTNIVMSIEGQISRSEAKALIVLARNTGTDSVIVEIGTYRGRSTIALAFGSFSGNRNRIYAIDPHMDYKGVFGGQFGPLDLSDLYRNLFKAGVGELVAVVSLSSLKVAGCWSESNIGLLFIDGDHNYDSVRADFEAWSVFLKREAVVAFHDSNAPGVKRLLSDLTNQGSISHLGCEGELSWFKMKEKK